ncbi:hypothetical protein JCM14036_12750 [Desulfotomaculum defluvii]
MEPYKPLQPGRLKVIYLDKRIVVLQKVHGNSGHFVLFWYCYMYLVKKEQILKFTTIVNSS